MTIKFKQLHLTLEMEDGTVMLVDVEKAQELYHLLQRFFNIQEAGPDPWAPTHPFPVLSTGIDPDPDVTYTSDTAEDMLGRFTS